MGIRFSIRLNQPIDQKISVTWGFRWTIITAICEIGLAAFCGISQSLVHPIPDAAALELGILPNCDPVIVHPAKAVPHGMHVFTHNERPVMFRGCPFLKIINAWIHGCKHIHMIPVQRSFIMNRS